LRQIPDVDIVAVCNRSQESATKVADEFSIPIATSDYKQLLDRDDIDAVFIGTPPYFHHEAVLAALTANKHVLCQTRFAENSRQAAEMYDKAVEKERERGIKTMLCRPNSYTRGDRFMRHLLESNYAGRIHQVLAYRIQPDFVDSKAPLGRRQNIKLFGAINPMHTGYYWDVLQLWFGNAKRVLAQKHTFTTERREFLEGPIVKVELPDTLTAIAEMKNGSVIMNLQFWAGRFGSSRIEIYGEDGTIVYDQTRDQIFGARAGDDGLGEMTIPPELEDRWHVEEDFVALVRGEIAEARPSFLDGLKNIQYLEAVHRSSLEGIWIELP
jgi:predicted dehydrogenase